MRRCLWLRTACLWLRTACLWFSSISKDLVQLNEDMKLHFVWFTQKALALGSAPL